MNTSPTNPSPRPLCLWPAFALLALQWLARFVVPVIAPDALQFAVFGSLFCGLGIILWWLFFSRALWSERLIGMGIVVVAMIAFPGFLHESIATGMMGLMFVIFSIPTLSLALVAAAFTARNWALGKRVLTMAIAIILATGIWTLVRTEGFDSEMRNDLAWRWSASTEEKLLGLEDSSLLKTPALTSAQPADQAWPGFRGPRRDSRISNTDIETDWISAPPEELWRRKIGPGWSSFAARGDLIYTQEQRGEEEAVSCYRLSTGELVWRHTDAARFWESNAGAGPRSTPTLDQGAVYTLGATGILNALDAETGQARWTRNTTEDTHIGIPGWGMSGSPLLTEDLVIVANVGTLAAYSRADGELQWIGPKGGDGYSSPHYVTIKGVPQVLLASKSGIVSVDPSNGETLWSYDRPGGSRIVQPAVTDDGDLLLSRGERSGMARLKLSFSGDSWEIGEQWSTNRIKPYFSDFVIHGNHIYGFDGSNLVCIDLEAGQRVWKGGRYGSGQLLLLSDQDLLIIVSERGDLAMATAQPEGFTQLGRIEAIQGKTWNHPILVGDVLLVRNDQEMAAFSLAQTKS